MKNATLTSLLLALLILPLFGQQRPTQTNDPGSSISVGKLLHPDGTLDLSQGYKGNLDLSGFQVNMTKNGPQFSSHSTTNGNDKWEVVGNGLSGTDETVRSIVSDGTNLYIGGFFDVVADVVANGVAKWDGSNWSALGDGLSNNGLYENTSIDVYALALDGNGGLYAGGDNDAASAAFVAHWDGNSWSDLGGNFTINVNALLATPSGVYAGGSFLKSRGSSYDLIAYWDGTEWSDVGGGIPGDGVFSLISDGNGGLYAGGFFSAVGGTAVNNVAHWDGTNWSAVNGSGLVWVNALALDGQGGLYIGDRDLGVFHWDGTSLTSIGSNPGEIRSLAVDSNGGLYAAGDFSSIDGVTARSLAYWNGTNWIDKGTTGMVGGINSVILDGNGKVSIGGSFMGLSGTAADNFAQLDGTNWSGLSNGFSYRDTQIQTMIADGNGGLYVGGFFSVLEGVTVNHVAYWDGTNWSALGSGVESSSVPAVSFMALDANGGLYIGGRFTAAGGNPARGLAYWNGSIWSDVGGSLTSGFLRRVLTLLPDDNGGLYIGGRFSGVGGNSYQNVAYWNGTTWSPLGDGFNNNVHSIISDGNGGIYAAGVFTASGETALNRVAHWNGTAWSPLGNGLGDEVNALVLDSNGRLYAGGRFDQNDNSPNFLAYWDGNNWVALGDEIINSAATTGISSEVETLAADGNGGIYAAGAFSASGLTTLNNIGHWDGTAWTALGDGTNRQVDTIISDGNGNIFACGDFTVAGNKASALVAQYVTQTSPLAAFTQSAASVVEGQSVTFDASGSTGEGLTYSWSFAGGSPATSTVVNPTVTYAAPGIFSVSLTATEGSNTNTFNGTVAVMPFAPTEVAASPNSASSITITWADNTQHETGYEIVRSTIATEDAQTGFATVDATYTVGANVITFTDTQNLNAGTTYYYRVRAVKN